MAARKTTFALFFGNRGFFPAALIAQARQDLPRLLQEWGYGSLMLEESATRYGAVETRQEGERYANFLRDERSKFDGVILCLPNFGDEFGAVTALKEAGVPILVQAYPDELDKMGPAVRRDAFCGKISVMDVFNQFGVKFTAFKPHVVDPRSETFRQNVDQFARVCRTANGVRGMVVGAIGARTTPFKTVRIDELALQQHSITVETLDLSDVMNRVEALPKKDKAYQAKAVLMKSYTSWTDVPEAAFDKIVRLGVVLDALVEEYKMDAVAIRCWTELQTRLGISPCVLMGEMNDRLVPAACEVDTGNAVMMHALSLASGDPPACLDWNNNYAGEENKCILFHCGPVPRALMSAPGQISDHLILKNSVGEGRGYGCNIGRIAPMDFTYGSLLTNAGRISIYLGEGRITSDPIPGDFFGCAGVAEVDCLQDVLLHIGRQGYRHHVSLTRGKVQAAVQEALGHYLGFQVEAV
jgi:L-fucose isomerase-like protein